MDYKLSDAELAIMQIMWEHGEQRATHIADIAKTNIGWEKNTSYTFIMRLIKKGAVTRRDPGFYVRAACEREVLLAQEAKNMVDKLYGGSLETFVHAFLDSGKLSAEEQERLKQLIESKW